MKDIEQYISPLIESQFPAFYQEDGTQFIAFMKAYYEWAESNIQILYLVNLTNFNDGDVVTQTKPTGEIATGVVIEKTSTRIVVQTTSTEPFSCKRNCRTLTLITSSSGGSSQISVSERFDFIRQARQLTNYRDIDTTLERFIVHFKEKYLKNIQFDTATNKTYLIKNAISLYRSKGTERSIDLFFKLVYGSEAEVRYPADNIFRTSDGVWEKPEYIEITHHSDNINYVGTQIEGSKSGAKAFVEKYIRRKVGRGRANILYVSNIRGTFLPGDTLGVTTNNVPVFNSTSARIVGSTDNIIIQDKSRDFSVGDRVNIEGSERGTGAVGRVANTTSATGIIDIIFNDGGWGYTLTANSIISEKVITSANVTANAVGSQMFILLEEAYQPIMNLTFTSATANLDIGDTLTRYSGVGESTGQVLAINQNGANGTITVSRTAGAFFNNTQYTSSSNTVTFDVDAIENRGIAGDIMGIPDEYTITVNDVLGTIAVGQTLIQKNSSTTYATGEVLSISSGANGIVKTLEMINVSGSFKKGITLQNAANASVSGNVTNVETTVGLYNIRKKLYNIQYTGGTFSSGACDRIFKYDNSDNLLAEGQIISIDDSSGSGNVAYIPTSGYFLDGDTIYTTANGGSLTAVTVSETTSGGDFISSSNSKIIGLSSNVEFVPTSISFGSGGEFSVGSITNSEVIFINTDILSANTEERVDFDRKSITIASNTGLSINDVVYQEVDKIAFDPDDAVIPESGFIALPTANSKFLPGDIINYEVASGNTAINYLRNNTPYYVVSSNSTGLTLSLGHDPLVSLNTTNYSDWANNLVAEEGHFFYKKAIGSVFELGSGLARVKDVHKTFGATGGTANTTTSSNSNLILYSNTDVNTSITSIADYATYGMPNQPYLTLSVRANAYGFEKSPQSAIESDLFSYMRFQRFELGTIATLTSIDPGSEYNVDPYVLAYQPYIAEFNRKDFVLNIEDATKAFSVGELVTQTQANLVLIDLQVDGSVYSNSFSGIIKGVQSEFEINSANDFIFIPANTISFNYSSDADETTDFIKVSNNSLSNGDYVRYYTGTGNTAAVGSNNDYFFVVSANDSGFALSTTSGGANSDLTSSNTEEFDSNIDVTTADDFIAISSNPFANDDQIIYYTNIDVNVLSGLANDSIYYAVEANSTGTKLSATNGGAAINIAGTTDSSNGHFLKYYNAAGNGHYIVNYSNPFTNGQLVVYKTPLSNTALTGLTNATSYYVVGGNTIGIQLATSAGGANVNITANSTGGETHYIESVPGYLPGDQVYQNVAKTFDASAVTDNTIPLTPQPYGDGDAVLYYTAASNTVVGGLTNATSYFVVSSNSTVIKLSETVGGAEIELTAGSSETGHNLLSVPTANVDSVYLDGANSFVRIKGADGTFANDFVLYANTNSNLSENVSNVDLFSITSTASGIVKAGSNSSVLYVKRISFENTFQPGSDIIGTVTSATANLINAEEQTDIVYPIGLNANLEANVVIANGQIEVLNVFDSGFGYSNNEIVQYVSQDGDRSGTAKIVIGGSGEGAGYYKSSRGFLSSDQYLQDGDYYQEYSYEIFSKISFDKYKDMFKSVMHTAGTKFFGSAMIIEEANTNIELSEIATSYEVAFNASTDVDNGDDSIAIGDFANGDVLYYTTATGNTVVSGLTNATSYFVVGANSSVLQLAETSDGDAINITAGSAEVGHYLTKTVEE